jgi:hypothetical protein
MNAGLMHENRLSGNRFYSGIFLEEMIETNYYCYSSTSNVSFFSNFRLEISSGPSLFFTTS